MGIGASNPKTQYERSSGSRSGFYESRGTPADRQYQNSVQVASTNRNVHRVPATIVNNCNGQRRHNPKPSNLAESSAIVRNVVYCPTNPKPAVLIYQQPVKVVRVDHSHVQRNQPRSTRAGGSKPKTECRVCGHTGHSTDRCHHRRNTCYICNEPGHLASVCRQKVHHTGSRYKPRVVEH